MISGEDSYREIITFTKHIADVSDTYNWSKYGFSFEAPLKENPFCIKIAGYKNGKGGGFKTITLDQEYKPTIFKEFIQKSQGLLATSFLSLSGNQLVVPTRDYVSLYNFSKEATNDEIIELWRLAYKYLKNHENKIKKISVHTGSQYEQSVAHFHLRLDTKKT